MISKLQRQTKRNGCLRASCQGGGHAVHRIQNAVTHTKCDILAAHRLSSLPMV